MKLSDAKAAVQAMQAAIDAAESAGREEVLMDDIFAADDSARAEQVEALARALARGNG